MESSTNKRVTTSSVAVRYGVLTGLVSIIFAFVILATGQLTNTPLQFVGLIIPIVGIYLAHKAFKGQNGGYMSYGQGLGIGTLLSVISGVISVAFNYLYKEFIDPELSKQILEQTRAKLEQGGNMSDAQIDQAMSISSKFSSGPISLVIGLLSSIILGVVISLIVAAFTKNAKPEFE